MSYLASQINNMLTMHQVIERYCNEKINRNNTIKCPFHNENTASFRLYDNSFYCFGCGKGGDIIKFIELYFNVNFQQSLMRLNYDFALNLPIGKKITPQEQKELKLQNMRIQANKLLEQRNKERKTNRYYDTLGILIELEKNKRDYAPNMTQNINEMAQYEFADEYAQALHKIDYILFLLNIRDAERSEV